MEKNYNEIEAASFANQSGFTLLELLIATVILAIGLLGVAALQTVAIHGNVEGRNFTFASTMIAEKIEDLRNGDFEDIEDHTDYVVLDGGVPRVRDSEPSDGFYLTRVVDREDGPVAGTVVVAVEVSWESRTGLTRRTEFETIIGN
ncbi:MAG: prepilin-type N-terminal cleavage/methylation domain-containing protein [Desulfococcaceae bacterium]